ncbi:hypothetical protein K0M31_009826 [Melipona bicolor]|uniref:Uncharacterized protein n=1 Tax=Melipona bicolor TaxID=60889 RepID=A0AA40FML8_9HYME|nr:hypothetical protein K0M31_009826 [Melipona bicolor]
MQKERLRQGVEEEGWKGQQQSQEEEKNGGAGILEGTKGQQVLCHRARVDPASSGALLADCESRGPGHPPHACFCTSDVIEIWLAPSRLSRLPRARRARRTTTGAMRAPEGQEARKGVVPLRDAENPNSFVWYGSARTRAGPTARKDRRRNVFVSR